MTAANSPTDVKSLPGLIAKYLYTETDLSQPTADRMADEIIDLVVTETLPNWLERRFAAVQERGAMQPELQSPSLNPSPGPETCKAPVVTWDLCNTAMAAYEAAAGQHGGAIGLAMRAALEAVFAKLRRDAANGTPAIELLAKLALVSTERDKAREDLEHFRTDSRELREYAAWLAEDDSGISSESIVIAALGLPPLKIWGSRPPGDAGDRGRCVRMLRRMPWAMRGLELLEARKPEWRAEAALIRKELAS